MIKLYRNPGEVQHWLVWSESCGWERFPAKINGWTERCSVTMVDRPNLHRVPLWMAFNTGLLESVSSRNLERAA